MIAEIKNNKIFFNEEDKAFANLTFDKNNKSIHLELIKVVPKYRRMHLATLLMKELLLYVDRSGYTYVDLNPLPLDKQGMNLKQLMVFYEKFGFKLSENNPKYSPYLMNRIYCCI